MTPIDAVLIATLFSIQFAPHADGQAVTALHYDPAEIKCLGKMIYHETRGRDFYEGVEIAHATLARIGRKYGGAGVCKVIAYPGQFPWHRRAANMIDDMEAWRRAAYIAAMAYTDLAPARLDATHFDTCGRNPQAWKERLPFAGQVGRTCFWNDK